MDNCTKRARTDSISRDQTEKHSPEPLSLRRSISPPVKRIRRSNLSGVDLLPQAIPSSVETGGSGDETASEPEAEAEFKPQTETAQLPKQEQEPGNVSNSPAVFSSPVRLTHIRDLGAADNVDAVKLSDLVGDPLISEIWNFNYLHDVDFLINELDEDVRGLVKVHIIHGFWKREDASRIALQEAAERRKNVVLHTAYLPEMFGTHHSKMLVLLRHDDSAQVVIHTANMIPKDWTNMTQAIWMSPLLPLLSDGSSEAQEEVDYEVLTEGSGQKFKVDLLKYLRAYNDRRPVTNPLVQQLRKYDFSSIRGTLIASCPGRHDIADLSMTTWGWAAMKRALRSVPLQEGKSEVVVQISSIATLGPTDTWLRGTLFAALSRGRTQGVFARPLFKIVFPTADEIRRSLDGYGSGASIHTKIQSAQQAKQLIYSKPMLCHWANDCDGGKDLDKDVTIQDAGRKRAAPHVKTYIRYGEKSLDWALVTSANLSKQAWGDAIGAGAQMRISSWEIGVLVWPGLYAEDARMTPVFRGDAPSGEDVAAGGGNPVVGLRLPYSLPLQRYGEKEEPWVATASYEEPDWMGRTW